MGPSLPGFTIVPCVDSLLCYRLIKRPKCILQDSPKIYDICMHLYNCIWVILLISRLNLAFLSLKLSRGIDIVLVCLYSCGFDNPRNTLRWKLLQLASVCLRIILFGLRTVNIFQTLSRAKKSRCRILCSSDLNRSKFLCARVPLDDTHSSLLHSPS
jgi:hypothetical protein